MCRRAIPGRVAFLALTTSSMLTASASGQNAPADSSVVALVAHLERNASFVHRGSDVTARSKLRILAREGCSLTLEQNVDAGFFYSSVDTLRLDLAALDPEVRIAPWEQSVAWEVTAVSSSVQPAIPWHGTKLVFGRAIHSDTSLDRHSFSFGDSAVASAAGRLLAGAIRACGGRQATPAARARALEREGKDPATLAALEQCHAQLRESLGDAAAARFPGAPVVVRPDSTQLMLAGKVQHASALGGTATSYFICNFRRAGDRWAPRNQPTILSAR